MKPQIPIQLYKAIDSFFSSKSLLYQKQSCCINHINKYLNFRWTFLYQIYTISISQQKKTTTGCGFNSEICNPAHALGPALQPHYGVTVPAIRNSPNSN